MNLIRPGNFGLNVSADARRFEFDMYNAQVLLCGRKPDYIFIGDSITMYWDIVTFFGNKNYVLNRGIGGDTSEYALKRFDADVIQLSPRHVIINIGTNDITSVYGDLLWKRPGRSKEAVAESALNRIGQMVKKAQNAGIIPICTSLFPNCTLLYDKKIRAEATVYFNEKLKVQCEKNNIIFVDYYNALLDPGEKYLAENRSEDGLHPNWECYKLMAQELRRELGKNQIQI